MLARPAIIDTDIGDDVDDAYALALALQSPELRLLGITTVAGPVEQRARMAQTLVAAAGMQVPVACGSSTMSSGRPGPDRFSHAAALAPAGSLPPVWSGTGVDLLLSHTASPGRAGSQATLIICLGPLTNLALALKREPALAGRIEVVAMAGKLGLPYPDWNLRCDPAAARAVLSSGAPVTLVGMHVTMATQLTRVDLAQIIGARRPLTDVLARCTLAWRTLQRRMPILHDALTVAVACDPTLATLERRRVLVGPRGFSCALRRAPHNALVAVHAEVARWRGLLVGRLTGERPALR